jgi:hypothetical protein
VSAGGPGRAGLARTADWIAGVQRADGAIPWFHDGKLDPWDHVEAALGLDTQGRHAEAAAAYDWLRRTQNADGSWFREYQGAAVTDDTREANFTAYVAVGLWYHYRRAGDGTFLRGMWPTLCRALDFVLGLQAPGGEVRWARGSDGKAVGEALLTGCASIYHSLSCAQRIADALGEEQPDWDLAATTLGHTLLRHPERFSPRDRFAMDWYYPILGGALRGPAAAAGIDSGWDTFVVPGLGVRCVSDRPWVTVAETCEAVLSLCAIGDRERAAGLFDAIGHLRAVDGSYWTGYVYPDDARWPVERTTWTAGAVLLAAAMLDGDPAVEELFGGAGASDPGCVGPLCALQHP